MYKKCTCLISTVVTFLGLLIPSVLFAHVGYVVPQEEFAVYAGSDFGFLAGAFTSTNLVMAIIVIIVVVTLYRFIKQSTWFIMLARHIEKGTRSYDKLIPWMIRLSLGIALVGAGTQGALISPIMSGMWEVSFIQIFLGFLILVGFMLMPVTLGIIALYITAVVKNTYMLGSLDFFALGVSLFILADSRPGVDDLFGVPFMSPMRSFKKYVPFLLRIGIGCAMLFLGIYEKILNPHLSRLVVENYHLTSVVPVSPESWVLGAGTIEVVIGIVLLLGFHTRLFSAIAFLVLSLSFFYFGEDVYSHVTLFGVLSILFVTGGGLMSVDKILYRKDKKRLK